MVISCSPDGIMSRECPAEGLQSLKNAGFDNILLDMGIYYRTDTLEAIEDGEQLEELLFQECRQKHLAAPIGRAPASGRKLKEAEYNDRRYQLAWESIIQCSRAGSRYVIVSPLCAGISADKLWETNREFYKKLGNIAREYHITILLENQCRDLGGHLVRGCCSNPYTAAEWIDELNREVGEERFGFCMDVSVCNVCGQNLQEFVTILQHRLKAVVLKDCDGHSASAGLPFTHAQNRMAQTDWRALVLALRGIGFDGQLILNMSDTAAAFSIFLRPSLLLLAKNVMEYFKWQIGIESNLKKYRSLVLFGAGNMCSNYMRHYGEKYPPLFTCDNNEKLWGSLVCGLEVKPPEALKSLPSDCGVVICNRFYREIEVQLQKMGIKNITSFNDEYMPHF